MVILPASTLPATENQPLTGQLWNRRVLLLDLEEARLYGHAEAAFLHRLRFWLQRNLAKGRNFIKGRTWSFSTHEEIATDLGLTINQVRRVVRRLLKLGAIIIDNFNRKASDRTAWYALADAVPVDLHGPSVQTHEWPVQDDAPLPVVLTTVEKAEASDSAAKAAPAAVAGDDAEPLKLNSEGGDMSEGTKNRNDAFRAVRGGEGKEAKTPPAGARDRGDVARRQDRDTRAGKPARGRPRRDGGARPREAVVCAVFDAWRDAMNERGFPTVQVAERRDAEDGARIVAKAGSVDVAIAYVRWMVANWTEVEKQNPRLQEFGMTFGTLAGGWMRNLFPKAMEAMNSKGASGKTSEAFQKYMALPDAEKAVLDPRKAGVRVQDELRKAMKAWMDAEEAQKKVVV